MATPSTRATQVDFPNNPSVNQTFISGNQTWVWDGVKWVVGGSPAAGSLYLPTAGGTMSGPLIAQVAGSKFDGVIGSSAPAAGSFTSLNGGPLAGLRNRIINGAFRVDQRNLLTVGAVQPGSGYVIDRWVYSSSQSNKFTLQAFAGNTGALGNAGWLTSTVATPATLAAADNFCVYQNIEGLNILDLGWGFSGAKPVTLSFLFYSSVAGTHSGSLINKTPNRCYVFTWNYPTPSVWQYVQVTIPGDTAGTWTIDNTIGIALRFNLGCGATYLGPSGAWGASNFVGATGSVQVVTAASASFVIGNVQLESGSIATPFEFRPISVEVDMCLRYFQWFISPTQYAYYFTGYAPAGTNILYTFPFKTMRAPPTPNFSGTWGTSNCGTPSIDAYTPSTCRIYAAITAAGYGSFYSPANGGFLLNAEL